MKKEKKETILQQGVNMRISCLRPDLFPVCEAMLASTISIFPYSKTQSEEKLNWVKFPFKKKYFECI